MPSDGLDLRAGKTVRSAHNVKNLPCLFSQGKLGMRGARR